MQKPSVSLVITTFNDAQFLSSALQSSFAQTHPFDEIIVVDDGSTISPEAIVAEFQGAHFIRQKNAGLSSARNTGLAAVTSDFVIFLDADDLLLPTAVAEGLNSHNGHINAAFVYGGYRIISADGNPLTDIIFNDINSSPYSKLLITNYIAMHATVMYRRQLLADVGGFDPGLPCCEDYDIYLRIARLYPIFGHHSLIAEYRHHSSNMTRNYRKMLHWALQIHLQQTAYLGEFPEAFDCWKAGQRNWRYFYASEAFGSALREYHEQRRLLVVLRFLLMAMKLSLPYTCKRGCKVFSRFMLRAFFFNSK
ncbi:glycosyltransferase family 2 protein [Synechococcus sp. CBW1107]|uniref:glycosyltransferase family 2 protein n=1 Tax=Synechococcus sp. CBW1107 TaxID=2789857 RepID=UPI002AD25FD7|nr:glycosyltransferase [Synechococcus sp. CBW1107]CAK6686867.1 hypothetical protein ICNINCKA_00087 [Synechococcus sp. CBW1107]